MFKRYRCTYCGAPSDQLDHVTPKSYSDNLSYNKEFVVPCCGECNRLLTSHLYFSIADRAEYLHKKYSSRYSKALKVPDWDEDELEEVSSDMRKSVLSAISLRDELKARLSHLKFVQDLAPSIGDVWSDIQFRLSEEEGQ